MGFFYVEDKYRERDLYAICLTEQLLNRFRLLMQSRLYLAKKLQTIPNDVCHRLGSE